MHGRYAFQVVEKKEQEGERGNENKKGRRRGSEEGGD